MCVFSYVQNNKYKQKLCLLAVLYWHHTRALSHHHESDNGVQISIETAAGAA